MLIIASSNSDKRNSFALNITIIFVISSFWVFSYLNYMYNDVYSEDHQYDRRIKYELANTLNDVIPNEEILYFYDGIRFSQSHSFVRTFQFLAKNNPLIMKDCYKMNINEVLPYSYIMVNTTLKLPDSLKFGIYENYSLVYRQNQIDLYCKSDLVKDVMTKIYGKREVMKDEKGDLYDSWGILNLISKGTDDFNSIIRLIELDHTKMTVRVQANETVRKGHVLFDLKKELESTGRTAFYIDKTTILSGKVEGFILIPAKDLELLFDSLEYYDILFRGEEYALLVPHNCPFLEEIADNKPLNNEHKVSLKYFDYDYSNGVFFELPSGKYKLTLDIASLSKDQYSSQMNVLLYKTPVDPKKTDNAEESAIYINKQYEVNNGVEEIIEMTIDNDSYVGIDLTVDTDDTFIDPEYYLELLHDEK